MRRVLGHLKVRIQHTDCLKFEIIRESGLFHLLLIFNVSLYEVFCFFLCPFDYFDYSRLYDCILKDN